MVTRAKLNVRRRRKRILWITVVAVAITLVVVVSALLVSASGSGDTRLVGQTIPPSLYQQLTGVSDATLSAVGSSPSVHAPTAITGTPLLDGGKPLVLYVGGEFCPF